MKCFYHAITGKKPAAGSETSKKVANEFIANRPNDDTALEVVKGQLINEFATWFVPSFAESRAVFKNPKATLNDNFNSLLVEAINEDPFGID